jgi:Ca-activated chloride channel homolog
MAGVEKDQPGFPNRETFEMQLLNPFWLLLLGLIPVLLIIHSLKPKAREVDVTGLFLWKGVLKEARGGSRIQSLMNNLPLWLQILIILLSSLALAEPVWTRPTSIKGNVVLVLDTSASMQTRTTKGLRFDQSKEKALQLISELSDESRMLIIEAGHRPEIKSPFSKDKKRLREVMEGIQPSDVSGDLTSAAYLALSFVEPATEDKVYLITDGAVTGLNSLLQNHRKIHPLIISEGEKNVGIINFQCRPDPGIPDVYQALIEVKNFNPHPVICPIQITIREETVFKKTVGLRGLEKKRFLIPLLRPGSGIVKASLDFQDDFPLDNQAYNILRASGELSILMVTRGNGFMNALLEAYPQFRVETVKEINRSSWKEQVRNHDLVILDGLSPPATERGNFLMINAFSPSIPITKVGLQENPVILDWDRRHPVMQDLDLGTLRIRSATRVRTEPGIKPLLEARNLGLIYAYEKEGLRAILINFDLKQSDLPLRVAFPVLMTNCFKWLQPHEFSFAPMQVKAGEPFPLYLRPDTQSVSIGLPSGKWVSQSVPSNPFPYPHTEKVGVYTVVEKEKRTHFAVNLFDESESNIRVDPSRWGKQPNLSGVGKETVQTPVQTWFLVLLGAVFLLVLEFYIWLNRR